MMFFFMVLKFIFSSNLAALKIARVLTSQVQKSPRPSLPPVEGLENQNFELVFSHNFLSRKEKPFQTFYWLFI